EIDVRHSAAAQASPQILSAQLKESDAGLQPNAQAHALAALTTNVAAHNGGIPADAHHAPTGLSAPTLDSHSATAAANAAALALSADSTAAARSLQEFNAM